MLETELYLPVQQYLEDLGYQVMGEVKHCDVAAIKDDEVIVVELKTSANITLLVQATDRQSIADKVYVALPRPKKMGKPWRGIQRVIKGLGLGLILVQESPLGLSAIPIIEAETKVRRHNSRKRKLLIAELKSRKSKGNIGGSVGKKLMTAYKENAILIACCLDEYGDSKPKILRSYGTGAKTLSILYSNHYGWFDRVERGVYGLSDKGRKEYLAYSEMVSISKQFLKKNAAESTC